MSYTMSEKTAPKLDRNLQELSENLSRFSLTAQQIETFETDGFLHLPMVFTLEEITLIKSYLSQSKDLAVSEHYGSTFRSWRNITASSRVLSGLSCDLRLVLPAVQLLGHSIKLMGSQLIERSPLDGSEVIRSPKAHGWHRDIFGLNVELGRNAPKCATKMAIWLSDANENQHGATLFVPGSHKLAFPTIDPTTADPENFQTVEANPGDVTIFENRTVHAGGRNTSSNTLEVLMLQYGFRWLANVAGQFHSEELLGNCHQLARELLAPCDIDEDGNYAPKRARSFLAEFFSEFTTDTVPS